MELEKDRLFVGRDNTAPAIEIARASGSTFWNSMGKKFIDFTGGWCVQNVGYNDPHIMQELGSFNGPNYALPYYYFDKWVELAELLAEISPGNLEKSFRVPSGSEAVEVALQAAMAATGRNRFVSVEGAYHGHTMGALSVGDSAFKKMFPKNTLLETSKIGLPLSEKAAKEAEKLLKTEKFAAFIAEPIIMNLGVEIPSKEFWEIVSDACRDTGTLLIADEVASGFGRTGKMFASEHYNLKPDVMAMAKGMSSGYGPIGAAIMTPKIGKIVEEKLWTYSTFGWTPYNTVAAIANTRHILENRLAERAAGMEKVFAKEIENTPFKEKPETRIKGLAIGLRFRTPEYRRRVVSKALENGLALSTSDDRTLVMFPALDISENEIAEGFEALRKSA
ncbi:MAG: aspartate aminotransferase family protein [Candidatus Diapherotrites archaeon]|nr:aspartate aminotransferase family protein [Candidatus Diapherotrites archaeon]